MNASKMAVSDVEIPTGEWFVATDSDGELADRLAAIWAEELDRLTLAGSGGLLRQAS